MGCAASSEGTAGHDSREESPRNFYKIADKFTSSDQVVEALRSEGLESSNLIVAVDFTKSNEWTGRDSFGGRCLHDCSGGVQGPYEEVIRIIGQTLSHFDEDGYIPCYGFGDVMTADHSVFSFLPNNAPCRGLEEVTSRYRELAPHVQLSGPTTFAPAIHSALRIVADSSNKFHILLIIADGQVTRPTESSDLSRHEKETVDAIIAASHLPLSIIMVGVGDGPWDMMKEFDDKLPRRNFDNFQFVNFTRIRSKYKHDAARLEAVFSLAALMEIPEQYKLIQQKGMLSQKTTRLPSCMRNFRVLDPHPPPLPCHHTLPVRSEPPTQLIHCHAGLVAPAASAPRPLGPIQYPADPSPTQSRQRPTPLLIPTQVYSTPGISYLPPMQALMPAHMTANMPAHMPALMPMQITANMPAHMPVLVPSNMSSQMSPEILVQEYSSGLPHWSNSNIASLHGSVKSLEGSILSLERCVQSLQGSEASAQGSVASAQGSVASAHVQGFLGYQQQQQHRPLHSMSCGSVSAPPGSPPAACACPKSLPCSPREMFNPLFVCPLTNQIMEDPVMLEDGYTYEREAIERWLSCNRKSPMTKQLLSSTALLPNKALRATISVVRASGSLQ